MTIKQKQIPIPLPAGQHKPPGPRRSLRFLPTQPRAKGGSPSLVGGAVMASHADTATPHLKPPYLCVLRILRLKGEVHIAAKTHAHRLASIFVPLSTPSTMVFGGGPSGRCYVTRCSLMKGVSALRDPTEHPQGHSQKPSIQKRPSLTQPNPLTLDFQPPQL